MERTTEIPPQGWFNYFAGLSRRAMSHPVRVEVESVLLGAQELVRALPLLGIDVEPRGSGQGDIEITLGDEQQDFLHRISRPVQVYLKIDENGDLDCLAIEDRSGTRTLLFFEEGGVSAWAHPSIHEAESPALGL